jgi:3-phenylpropionate/trans-cinnamate dioxygenase ferredoxin reductase subunit
VTVPRSVVVVGAGHAGFHAALWLRDSGWADSVVLIGDEPTLPYQRPPLSKDFLAGRCDVEGLAFRPAAFYEQHGITLRRGERVVAIDRGSRIVETADGTLLPYGHLVLATGSIARALPVPGADLDGVLTLRTVADAVAISARLASAAHVVVIGGGFIGLEVAAVAREAGIDVTVIEAQPRVLLRVASEATSAFFEHEHTRWGTRILTSTQVAEIVGDRGGRVAGVRTTAGSTHPADLVLVGIGALPNDELARDSGLSLDRGILVDRRLTTSDPAISAIGDCARYPSTAEAISLRLESVQNAVDHARYLTTRLGGSAAGYGSTPWFWSDQRDLKLQIAGITAPCDEAVLHGEPDERSFSVFCFRDSTLVGAESVNRPGDHAAVRRLLASGRSGPTPGDVAAHEFDVKRFARTQ